VPACRERHAGTRLWDFRLRANGLLAWQPKRQKESRA
jgi:hypothetical protein